ncbi:MAG: TonB-dependent receptor [Bacteroidetes bacterium]|nr:TonB-dependent receptor [Bacteroidota bacterium]
MRIIAILFLFIGITAFGQVNQTTPKGHGRIIGTVLDDNKQPVEFATVALVGPTSDKPIDGAICDDKGKFAIVKVPNGNYRLIISFIGYENTVVKDIVISDKKNFIDVGNQGLATTSKQLEAVVVEGQKVLVEEKVDRTVYNAENDNTAKGGDATDVLKRVPMLSVDMDGNVSLRGNQNIKVLINNKPSTITASSVADALKQIPADQIKTVEVITSPSAKYDAEGSAGIINIVTKKNTLQGMNLNIDGSTGYRGSNLSLNGGYRKGKLGISLGGFGRSGYNVTGRFTNSQLTTNTTTGAQTLNIQDAATRRQDLFGNLNAGIDYDINKTNSLTGGIRFGTRNGWNYQDNLLTSTYQNDLLTGTSLRNVNTQDLSNNIDASLNYTHTFAKPQREFSVLTLYSRNNRTNDFTNSILNQTDLTTASRLMNENKSFNEEITVQADYQTPISTNQLLEVGGKNISRNVSSDYKYFSSVGEGTYVPIANSSLANVFNYNQNITAGYLAYTYSSKSGYSLKAGSRYEYTTINANFATEKTPVVIPSYGVLVPSVNLSKKLKSGTVKIAYNRRIQRPSIQFLNPNYQASNPYNASIGNPNLGPEYTNNYELSYNTFINSTNLTFSTFVRNTDNAIQPIRNVKGDTVVTTYKNIGKEDAYGGSIFANVNVSNKLSLNGGADIYYAILKNNDPNPLYTASNQGWVVGYRFFGSYNITKGWGLQFFSFYRGRQVQLQGVQGSFYIYSLSIRKDLPNKKGSIGFGAEQFFTPAMRIPSYTVSPVVQQNSTNELHNMNFKITFSYRIGKMSFDQPRRKKSISNDDLKEGGGGGDMGGGDMGQQGGGGQRQGGAGMGAGARNAQQNNAKTNDKSEKKDEGFDPNAVVIAEGSWSYTVDSPQGGGGTLNIRKEGDKYAGSVISSRNNRETQLSTVTVNGNEISWGYEVNFGGNSSTISGKSIIKGDEMNGTITMGQFGSFPMKATRKP